jgi:hypothetical protein
VADSVDVIAQWEERLEAALWNDERDGSIDAAYEVFREGSAVLGSLDTGGDERAERERLRVLCYALLRESNALRRLDRIEEASAKDAEGLRIARLSDDSVSVGRMMLSIAGTSFAGGDGERGRRYLVESRALFAAGSTPDHVQGLGWTWVLEADVGNAKLVDLDPGEIVAACEEALRLLEPINNWPGIARAYEAEAVALAILGDAEGADEARRQAAIADAASA